jgi:Bacterial Ig-like domain
MNTAIPVKRRAALIASLMLTALPRILGATGPQLTALSFTPSINTATSPANVNVTFSATDASSSVFYFEVSFVDPSGIILHRGNTLLSPSPSVTTTVAVPFPQFSTSGTWQLRSLYLADSAGNATVLDTNAVASGGFPTTLQVNSAVDTTPPQLTAFSFTPSSVNVTSAAANVAVAFTATDNLSGANRIEVALTSPSGSESQRGIASVTPATTVHGSATITLPQGSEAGAWTVASVYLTDAAGNVLSLDTAGLSGLGFPTTVTVTSRTDNTPPVLTGFGFTPSSINTTSSSANVNVNFSATDDLSGVRTVQVRFQSPSGTASQQGSVTLTPATSTSGTVAVPFPRFSSAGVWTVASIFLSDAAGNTLVLDTAGLAAKGFSTNLTVISATDTTPPTLTALTFVPATINTTYHAANVTLSFHLTDDLSGATTFQGTFGSPSAALTQMANTSFAANTSVTGAATAVFPQLSEQGTWTLNSVLIADAAGNTRTLSAGALAGSGFPTQLIVNNVVDTTPPVISGMPAPPCTLWPPNGKLVQVATVTATDTLSGVAPGTFKVTGTSNEPSDPNTPDVVITLNPAGAYVVQLRQDRLATGTGRVYTLNATAKDIAGNTAAVTATCVVPHDQGN